MCIAGMKTETVFVPALLVRYQGQRAVHSCRIRLSNLINIGKVIGI